MNGFGIFVRRLLIAFLIILMVLKTVKKSLYFQIFRGLYNMRKKRTNIHSIGFSCRIAQIRREKKLTQEKLSKLLNVSQRCVASWELGERTPSFSRLIEIADKLNVSMDYLLDLSDANTLSNPPPHNRIKQLREQLNYTQADIGNIIGVTQQSVFAWEHGTTEPTIQTAITLCKVFNVSLDYLMGLSDIPNITSLNSFTPNMNKNTTSNFTDLPEPVQLALLELLNTLQCILKIG